MIKTPCVKQTAARRHSNARQWAIALGACVLAWTTGTGAQAQSAFPEKPIHLYVGFPPGGQSDIMTRMIGDALSRQLKQTVVVDNKAGASGTIAADFVARQAPDGYTLMVTSEAVQSRATAVFKKVPYDPVKDFTLIAKVAKQKAVMVVNANSPFTTVKEFIAYAKANPGKLNYGSTHGTTSQFGGALFSLYNGIEMVAVNYPGGSKPMTDLLGGYVDVGFFIESTVDQFVKTGKMRALAVISDEPGELLPNVPTIAQAGAKPMDISPWFGVVGPAKIPAPVVARITDALAKAAVDPVFKEQMSRIGAIPLSGSNPEKFTSEVKSEVEYWKKFVKDTNFPLLD